MTEEVWSEPLRIAGVDLRVKVRRVLVTGPGRCSAALIPLAVEIGVAGEVWEVTLR